ncbi:MAG TPA: amino acid ABC transporter substrate-binding protein [Lachnospiraceae bacterium]|nr:amino acid ABC transporter substrate-binding protein [Lachnospiraceae bacterium]
MFIMKKKILSLILGVSLVGTLLTGCGSAASASAAPAPAAEEAKEEAAPAAEAKADDAAEAGAEDEADQAGDVTVLEVALEANNAPYTYEDEDGNPAGYEYEVLKLIDEKLPQYEFNYTVIDYETAAAGVNTGKYAFESGCKFRTPAREEAFLVSEPYNYFFMNLVVKDDSGIEGLEDLSGKSIASIVGTDGRAVALNDWLKAHPDVDIQFEELAAAGAMADEIQGVEDGVFDAAYLSAEQAQAIFDESDYSDLKITDRVDGRDTVFLINKDSKDVQEALNSALKTLTDEGTLGSLTKEFFGEDNFEVAEKLGLKK